MATIGIIYFSGTGTTRAVADYVESGVVEAGATPEVFAIAGSDISEGRWANDAVAQTLDDCDAIIFGSPTYMGSVSAQMKAFFDAMAPRWYTQTWNGKLAAAFTASSLAAGDKLNCLQDIHTFAMQMGMIWVGTGASFSAKLNPNGFYLGAGVTASAPDQISEMDGATAAFLGKRVSELANRLS